MDNVYVIRCEERDIIGVVSTQRKANNISSWLNEYLNFSDVYFEEFELDEDILEGCIFYIVSLNFQGEEVNRGMELRKNTKKEEAFVIKDSVVCGTSLEGFEEATKRAERKLIEVKSQLRKKDKMHKKKLFK